MIKSGSFPRVPAIGAKIKPLVRLQWFFGLMLAVLVSVAATPPNQQNPDEQYIHIMALIDRGDALRKTGQADAAKAKYKEAQRALLIFKATNPLFAPKTVTYRLKELSDELETRPEVTEPTPTAAKPKAKLEAEDKSGVKVLDAGSEPRKALRLHVKAGEKQTMVLTAKIKMDVPTPGGGAPGAGAPGGARQGGGSPSGSMDIPAVTIPMDITVESVAANGDISYKLVLGDVAVANEAGANPQMVAGIKTALGGLKGITAAGVMSSRAINKKFELSAATSNQPQMRQAIDQMKEGMSNMGAHFPEEPVGPGAKWQLQKPVKTQGIAMDQTQTYELVSVEGDQLKLKFSANQSAANQKIQNAAMGGAQMNLIKMNVESSGTVDSDLSKLWGSMTMDVHMDMNAEVTAANKKIPVNMKMDMNLTARAQ
jgi:hypothetical protein